jgi:hypothetical protein
VKTHRTNGRLVVAAFLAVLLLGTSAAVTVATASPPAHKSASQRPFVGRLHLVERVNTSQLIDLGQRGMSVGDREVTRSDILDSSGRLVGRSDGDCVITGVGAKLGGLCHGVLTLAGGQLVGEFAWGKSGSNRYQAITGGTGKYAGAHGQAIVDTNGTDAHESFVIQLIR